MPSFRQKVCLCILLFAVIGGIGYAVTKKGSSGTGKETCTDPVPKGTRSCLQQGIGVDPGTTCRYGQNFENTHPNVLCCPDAPKCTADDLGPPGSAALGAVWGAPLAKLCMATASYDPEQCQQHFPDDGSMLCRPSPAACASLSAADCRDLQTAPFTPPCTVPMPDECRPACTVRDECRPACTADQCHAVCRPSTGACKGKPTLFTC